MRFHSRNRRKSIKNGYWSTGCIFWRQRSDTLSRRRQKSTIPKMTSIPCFNRHTAAKTLRCAAAHPPEEGRKAKFRKWAAFRASTETQLQRPFVALRRRRKKKKRKKKKKKKKKKSSPILYITTPDQPASAAVTGTISI